MVYWEGVLANQKYKSITIADQVPVYEAVQRALGMNTSSLVNSGWEPGMDLFGDRLNEVERQAQSLISQFCGSRACIDEAAYSLIVLGVPARTLTLDCAEHSVGVAQEYCTSALANWKGPESVDVAQRLVTNPSTSVLVRRSAAFALEEIAEPSSGPALHQALRLTSVSDQNSSISIVGAIARIRYRPAGADILARLMAEKDRAVRTRYVRALAALQYGPAIPAIEKLCETKSLDADWASKVPNGYVDDLPEAALLRLTPPWGLPVDGIRLRLLGPKDPIVSGHAPFASLIENVGDTDLAILPQPGAWVVDGQEYRDRTIMFDGNPMLDVNGITLRTMDLSGMLRTPGTHTVQYRFHGATSNAVTIRVSRTSQ